MIVLGMHASERATDKIEGDTCNERETEQSMNIYLTRKHPGYKVQCGK